MSKQINVILIILITGFCVSSVQSKTTSSAIMATQIQSQDKDSGSPIKRWAGDAKCKLKRFFGGNCH